MSAQYLLQKITAIEALHDQRVRVTFSDGFAGEVDLGPLLDCGPIFAPLADPEVFRAVRVIPGWGVPEWPGAIDLSPGSLRAWCEAGRFMDYDETDAWISRHSHPPTRAVQAGVRG